VIKLCEWTLQEVQSLISNMKTAVSEAYEQKSQEQGRLTYQALGDILKDFKEQIVGEVVKEVGKKVETIAELLPTAENHQQPTTEQMEPDDDQNAATFADGDEEEIADERKRKQKNKVSSILVRQ
jgi:hypothetical protein